MPCFFRMRMKSLATSLSMPGVMRSRNSTTVTCGGRGGRGEGVMRSTILLYCQPVPIWEGPNGGLCEWGWCRFSPGCVWVGERDGHMREGG
eukprot:scaffold6599_cov84-Isochrysis_galbana.AAC.1